MAKRSVVVHIAGQRYVVRSGAEKAYVQELAQYVDARLDEVQQSSRRVPTQSLAILAALNIADELFQERRRRRELKTKVLDKSREVLMFLDKEVMARRQQQAEIDNN